MTATDPVVTLAYFIKFEAPDGDVRLSDGGFLDYDSERYTAKDDVFGSIHAGETLQAGFGDLAEAGTLVLAPNPDATLTDWWRADLADCRVRIWQGDLDADNVTVTNAKQLADWLVDTIAREQDVGTDLLTLGLIGRAEKLFLVSEGNVCSQRHHQSVWPGEKGFNNCTDLEGFFAWGLPAPRGRSLSNLVFGGVGYLFG